MIYNSRDYFLQNLVSWTFRKLMFSSSCEKVGGSYPVDSIRKSSLQVLKRYVLKNMEDGQCKLAIHRKFEIFWNRQYLKIYIYKILLKEFS
jgi:hypothetical protein